MFLDPDYCTSINIDGLKGIKQKSGSKFSHCPFLENGTPSPSHSVKSSGRTEPSQKIKLAFTRLLHAFSLNVGSTRFSML
jgi:hypothetical protein